MTPRLVPGTTIDGLTVRRRIGAGGSGITYLVHNSRIGRDECMKVIPASLSADEMALWAEARKVGAFGIPGVVTIFSAGHIENASWFTMEYAPHGDLRGAVHKLLPHSASPKERFSLALSLLNDIAIALDTLHSLSPPMIHGDIKPGNILVFNGADGRPQAKLADFGLTDAYEALKDPTTTPAPVSGTLPYLAPERFHGAPPSPDADRYAFACSAFELLTGHRAFDTRNGTRHLGITDQISAYRELHINQHRPTPGSFCSNLRKADRVFATALSLNPDDRPPTAVEFQRKLAAALGIQTGSRAKVAKRAGFVAGGAMIATIALASTLILNGQGSNLDPSRTDEFNDASLPIDRGCPQDNYLSGGAPPKKEDIDKHLSLLNIDLPDHCIYSPSLDAINQYNAGNGFIMIYVFNSDDEQTIQERNTILDRLLNNSDAQETRKFNIFSSRHSAQVNFRFATDLRDLDPDDPTADSSACTLSSQDEVLTVLQVNHGFAPNYGSAVGDGTDQRSQTCGAATQLVETWMDATA